VDGCVAVWGGRLDMSEEALMRLKQFKYGVTLDRCFMSLCHSLFLMCIKGTDVEALAKGNACRGDQVT